MEAGEKVKVTGGGYKGSLGLIEAVDGDLAKVKVESFGMPMSVRIPLNQLEKVDGEES
ncbi:MAG: KOW motif-containing protein [Chloroflexota bacterium]|nr:KOW motif-containing protein [Chloroflexota bacterium]